MNAKNEEKLLKEFIKIIDEPEKAEKKFIRYAKISMFVSVLVILFCFSDNIDFLQNKFLFTFLVFIAGTAFGLSLWFLQAGTQTGIMVRHMSRDSIQKRMEQIRKQDDNVDQD